MKKPSFLHKLRKEGKLQIVEPSEDIKKAYFQRSQESLTSAKALMAIGNLKDSIALSYYAMYHCLLALLFRAGIKSENHTASILLLKSVFGLNNAIISKAKGERVDKQYYVDFEVSKQEANDAIRTAETFIAEVTDFIEKLSEAKIVEYQQRARQMMQ